MDIVTQKVIQKVKALMQGTVTLQMRRDNAGNIEVPTGATLGFALHFTIPELRESGVNLSILTEDGRVMTDDEYAAALQAALEIEAKKRG